MKFECLVLPAAFAALFTAPCKGQETVHWPEVAPLAKTFYIDEADLAQVDLSILGTDNRPLYALKCLGLRRFRDDLSFNWSGEFNCRLTSLYSQDYYSTLLTENPAQEADWDSRGRFFAAAVFP